jgi:hypothetical protein
MSIWTDLLFLHGFLVRPAESLPSAPATTPTRPRVERRPLKLIPPAGPPAHSAPAPVVKPRRSVEQEAQFLRELWGFCH